MKIIFTKHAEGKFEQLERLGWRIKRQKVIATIRKPLWRGTSRLGQETASSLIDERYILRAILDRRGDIIKVITFYPARRGKYESTL